MAGDSNKEKMEELLKTLTRSGNSDPADFPSRNSSTGLHGSQADASYELSVPPSPSPKQLVQTSSQMRTTSQNTRIPRGSGRQKLSLNDVGEQYVLLLDAIDKLKLGSEIDLPEIVVLGDQSEGKSTVLEAIAKVKLPKGEGTCTKCLIRLSIRCKDKEHATIETSFDGKSINVESQEDFSSKLKDIMNEKFPGQNISMNSVINIRVSGPDRPNLTVVDAPGFKSDMKEDDENTVALREKLNKPNILMVVVLKAVNDIDTSKGYDFAKRLDPEFKRTVFVLTHCDNLAENKQLKVPDMLRDRDAFAVHCYSKTGRYSSDEETDFFKRQSFWQNQPQSKLGLDALINHLAENMYRILRPRKEEFRSKLLNLWRDEAKELEKLKDENDGANSELKNLFIKLNKKLEEQLTGTCRKKKNELFSECKMKWNKFEQDLKTIAEEVLEPNH
uniref:Dynamin-type G domain-containing protein n=1 Tax=Macrostomum lignano TaxID=282301 RepID=A0A1I8J092_9PLAT